MVNGPKLDDEGNLIPEPNPQPNPNPEPNPGTGGEDPLDKFVEIKERYEKEINDKDSKFEYFLNKHKFQTTKILNMAI